MGRADRRKGFILRQLRGTEWSQLVDFLTPAFFDVMPVRSLLSQGRELLGNARDTETFRSLQARTRELARARGRPWRIVHPDALGPVVRDEPSEDERRQLGAQVLRLYFDQLYARDAALLDLRAGAFHFDRSSGEVVWAPRSFYVRWQSDFLSALRTMYRGFYREDHGLFMEGVERMALAPAAGVLLEHFGTGDQTAVRFRTAEFHATFHNVFVRCREEGLVLHRNFIALGIYLACLYDLLESLELPFDVRSAFDASQAST